MSLQASIYVSAQRRSTRLSQTPLYTPITPRSPHPAPQLVVKLEYPLWLVYVSQVLLLGGSLGGITYGIISSSWEPGREGSFWGWTEAKGNLPLLLNRNKK